MKKISRGSTVFYKKLFPLMWLGFMVLFLCGALSRGDFKNENLIFLIVPCIAGVLGFFLMKKFLWDLMDEVYDGGDFLLVKNRDEEEKVLLSNIMNVSVSV